MRWVGELARGVWRSRSGGSGRGALNDGPVGEGAVDAEGGGEKEEKEEEPAEAGDDRLGGAATAA
jgi:hypothetical protein